MEEGEEVKDNPQISVWLSYSLRLYHLVHVSPILTTSICISLPEWASMWQASNLGNEHLRGALKR